MSERSDDGKMGAFLLGFLLGVVVCLGGGGVFISLQWARQEAQTRDAMMRADEMAAMAHEAEAQARAERARAEKLLEAERKVRKAAEEDLLKKKDQGKD